GAAGLLDGGDPEGGQVAVGQRRDDAAAVPASAVAAGGDQARDAGVAAAVARPDVPARDDQLVVGQVESPRDAERCDATGGGVGSVGNELGIAIYRERLLANILGGDRGAEFDDRRAAGRQRAQRAAAAALEKLGPAAGERAGMGDEA